MFHRLEGVHQFQIGKNFFKLTIIGGAQKFKSFWLGAELSIKIVKGFNNPGSKMLSIFLWW